MKFGEVELKHGLMLAPMAGFTDRAARFIAHKFGAEYSVTEMVSAKAVVYNDEKTFHLSRIGEGEGKVAVQIFGSDAEIMARAAALISEKEYANGYLPVAIDINMGCPVRKIFTNKEGSALMENPDLIYKITRAVSSEISIPTTVKMRSGIDSEHVNAVECALAAEAGGASLITIHGRTRAQLYSGTADLEIIKKVKSALKIPVVANGDILDAKSALKALSYTAADGIMIGRASIGNPFIFSEILAALNNTDYVEPNLDTRIETALLQLKIAIEDKGEMRAVCEARGQLARYLHSFCGAARLRAEINRASSYNDVEIALNNAKTHHGG